MNLIYNIPYSFVTACVVVKVLLISQTYKFDSAKL